MTDYEPFGMPLAMRHYVSGDGYRFGFNGKEADDEWNGEGNMYNYGFRIHDPRLGRFLSVDPLAPDFPKLTTYQYAGNTPINAIDIDGLEQGYSFAGIPNLFEFGLPQKTDNLEIYAGQYVDGVVDHYKGYAHNPFEGFDLFDYVVAASNPPLVWVGLHPRQVLNSSEGIYVLAQQPPAYIAGHGTATVIDVLLLHKATEALTPKAPKLVFDPFLGEKVPGSQARSIYLPIEVEFKPTSSGSGFVNFDVEFHGRHLGNGAFEDGTLFFDLDIPVELQGAGLGEFVCNTAVDKFGVNKLMGLWVESPRYPGGKSVNLTKYQAARAQGSSPQNAAFATNTGQWMKKLGFDHVIVTESPTSVEAEFSRGK
jgi:RHS repeat-associated protein